MITQANVTEVNVNIAGFYFVFLVGWLYTRLDFSVEKCNEGQPGSGPSVFPDVGTG